MLTPREERVIRRRFGIGVNDATLEESDRISVLPVTAFVRLKPRHFAS
jgi:hypothetical protein